MATPRKGPEAGPKVRSAKSPKKGAKDNAFGKVAGRFGKRGPVARGRG